MAQDGAIRAVSPDVTRTMWDAIRHLEETNQQPATVDALFDELKQHFQYESKAAVEHRLYAAFNARLLGQAADPVTGETVYTVPSSDQPQGQPGDEHLSKNLEDILMFLHNKGGVEFRSPRQQCGLPAEQYATTVPMHVDLETIRQKLNARQYADPWQFLVDFQQLCHNVIALFGKDAPTFNLARELSKQMQAEISQLDRSSGDAVAVTTGVEQTQSGVAHLGAAAQQQQRRGIKRPSDMAPPSVEKRRPPPSSVGAAADAVAAAVGPNEQVVEWSMDERFKQMIMELQRYWLAEYQQSREKLLVEMTEKLHQEFLSDQQKIRTELLTQFKDELDATRQELEQKYRDTLKQELHKLQERHRREIGNCKKKQWCWQCESEAIYHCCWNTAYCSVECQQAHWPTHRKYCRRKKSGGGGGAVGGAAGAATGTSQAAN